MKPFRKREKKPISDFLEHIERPVAVTGMKGKVSMGQALGNTSLAGPRGQAERREEPARKGSVSPSGWAKQSPGPGSGTGHPHRTEIKALHYDDSTNICQRRSIYFHCQLLGGFF